MSSEIENRMNELMARAAETFPDPMFSEADILARANAEFEVDDSRRGSQRDGSRRASSRHDNSQQGGSQHRGSQQDGSRHDKSQHRASRRNNVLLRFGSVAAAVSIFVGGGVLLAQESNNKSTTVIPISSSTVGASSSSIPDAKLNCRAHTWRRHTTKRLMNSY